MTSAYISKVNFEQNEKIKGCTARIYLNALLLLTHSQSFVLGLLLRKSRVIHKIHLFSSQNTSHKIFIINYNQNYDQNYKYIRNKSNEFS